MEKLYCSDFGNNDPIDRILKRQSERKKPEDKNNLDLSNYEEIEKFTEDFNLKQKEIEKKFDLMDTVAHDKLHENFSELNREIQSLQRFYSNATIFLRIYDRKICQSALHGLQMKLKDLENKLLPKKKFGFKNRSNKVEGNETKNGIKKESAVTRKDSYLTDEICGFSNKENEVLVLEGDEIDRKDVVLTNLNNCTIKVYGNPSTMHVTNLKSCQVYSGPVTTSVFVENVRDSCLHLACQQLRIHETKNTDFFIHVTSKAIIEDSKDVRFGVYKLNYKGIDDNYEKSGLNRQVNNWDKVDDFNWLAADQPSPNWSALST